MLLYTDKDLYTREFYVEDFTKFYSFITTDDPVGNFNDYYNRGSSITFKIEDQKYEGRGSDNFILCYLSGTDESKLKLIFSNTQFLVREKGQFKTGFKPIKKGSGLFYFQQTFSITDFCPGYCVLNEKHDFGALYKIKLNPEDLFNELYNYFMKNPSETSLPLNSNFVNIYNLESVLTIVNLLSYIIGNDDMKKTYNSYEKCKENIFYIKQDYQLFRQTCLSFYDNFSTKLNLDRLASVYVLCNNYLTKAVTYSKYYTDPDLIPVISFIKLYGQTLYNFITLGKTGVITQIRDICDNILNAKLNKIDDLENGARNVGMIIYNLTMTDIENKKSCLYDIRSPFGFLTNLIGNSSGIVSNVTFDYKEQYEEKMKSMGMSLDETLTSKMEEDIVDQPQQASIDATKKSLYSTLQKIINTSFGIDSVNIVNNLIEQYNNAENDNVIQEVNTQSLFADCDSIYTSIVEALNKNNQQEFITQLNKQKDFVMAIIKVLLVLRDYLMILSQLSNTIQNEAINGDTYGHYATVITNILKPQGQNFTDLVNFVKAVLQNNNLVTYAYLQSNYPYNK